jgi:hypothetical protein
MKSPPDTPPRTPSPSISIERPLTPHTPHTPTPLMTANDRSALVSPACSTSSKASSVDSHSSKRVTMTLSQSKSHNKCQSQSMRSKHANNHSKLNVSAITANNNYNCPVSQSSQSSLSSLSVINNYKSLYGQISSASQSEANSNKFVSRSQPFMCNYSLESNQRHSNYSNACPVVEYNELDNTAKANTTQQQYRQQLQLQLQCNSSLAQLIHNPLYSVAQHSASNASLVNQYPTTNQIRAQMNGQSSISSNSNSILQYGQQQKLLRPSRLDAVIRKDSNVV